MSMTTVMGFARTAATSAEEETELCIFVFCVCFVCVRYSSNVFLPPLHFYTQAYLIAMPNATAAIDSKVMMPIKTKNRPTSGRKFASQ